MLRVLSVSSSRADIGILLPVWRALLEAGSEVHIFLTGMHEAAALEPGVIPTAARLHRGGADLGGAAPRAAAEAMAAISAAAARVIAEIAPDIMLVVGDRLDMVPAALAAVPFNLPLAHLHGGEITEGALDDRLRHATTKLAHLHCVSSDGARRRVLALGEEEWRIHVTGAPGLDTLQQAPAMGRREFLDAVGFAHIAEDAALRLVTVHPETNSPRASAPLEAVLAALVKRPSPTLITAPNSDPSGHALRAAVEDFAASQSWVRFHDTLGSRLYPNALRHADVMIGNSSSGIIEAPFAGLPVIDVGDRQKGRERGKAVRTVPCTADAVVAALDSFGSERPPREQADFRYGDGHAGPRVARALVEAIQRDGLLAKRHTDPGCGCRA